MDLIIVKIVVSEDYQFVLILWIYYIHFFSELLEIQSLSVFHQLCLQFF